MEKWKKIGELTVVEGFSRMLRGVCPPGGTDQERAAAAWRRTFQGAWWVRLRRDEVLEWETEEVPKSLHTGAVVFIWAMGLGEGSEVPQPTGKFELFINGASLLAFCVQKHSERWTRGDAALYFEVKRRGYDYGEAVYGLGYLLVPQGLVRPGEKARITVVPSDSDSERWFKLYGYRERNLDFAYLEEGLRRLTDDPPHHRVEGYTLYWGDIHGHTGISGCGIGTADEYYQYAREVSNLDFFSLTDHCFDLNSERWAERLEKNRVYYEPGRFATLLGFEWTSNRWGHRNVYYRGEEGEFFSRNDPRADTPQKLAQRVWETGQEAMIIVHHPSVITMSTVNWDDYYGEVLEPVMEITSIWGNSEYFGNPNLSRLSDHRPGCFVQDALARGYRLGFIGGGTAMMLIRETCRSEWTSRKGQGSLPIP